MKKAVGNFCQDGTDLGGNHTDALLEMRHQNHVARTATLETWRQKRIAGNASLETVARNRS